MPDIAYLQFGEQPGPFLTVKRPCRLHGGTGWQVQYEGRWRKVYIQIKRTYIVCVGKRYTVLIEGV